MSVLRHFIFFGIIFKSFNCYLYIRRLCLLSFIYVMLAFIFSKDFCSLCDFVFCTCVQHTLVHINIYIYSLTGGSVACGSYYKPLQYVYRHPEIRMYLRSYVRTYVYLLVLPRYSRYIVYHDISTDDTIHALSILHVMIQVPISGGLSCGGCNAGWCFDL